MSTKLLLNKVKLTCILEKARLLSESGEEEEEEEEERGTERKDGTGCQGFQEWRSFVSRLAVSDTTGRLLFLRLKLRSVRESSQ